MSGSGRRRWIREHRIHIAVAGLLLIATALYIRSRGDHGAEDSADVAQVEAETVMAVIQPFAVTIPSLGTVEPRPGAFGRIAAPAATRVTRVLVGEGDHVRAGQALIELDASVFDAQAQQAQAAFDQAERALARQTRLQSEGIAPRKDVEAAAADLGTARAALVEARRIQAMSTLRAPLSGVVAGLDVALGQPVDANEPLVTVLDPSRLEIMFHVSPEAAARITAGSKVELTTGAKTTASWVGSGVVRGISAVLDSASRSVEIRVSPVGRTRILRAGEEVAGGITVATHPRAVVIPVEALVPGDEGPHVFVVDAAGIAHETPVTTGERNGTVVEIVAGLKGGERVVTVGAYGVSDGAHVIAPGDTAK
jgi:membrane fusion protein (multidrug efflux system)